MTATGTSIEALLPLVGNGLTEWKRTIRLWLEGRFETQLQLAQDMAERLGRGPEYAESSLTSRLSLFLNGKKDEVARVLGHRTREPILAVLAAALHVPEEDFLSLLRRCAGEAVDPSDVGWHPAWPGVRADDVLQEPRLGQRHVRLKLGQFFERVTSALTRTWPSPSFPVRVAITGRAGSGASTAARFVAEQLDEFLGGARQRASEKPGSSAVPDGRVRVTRVSDGAVLRDRGTGPVLVEFEVLRSEPSRGRRYIEEAYVLPWTWGDVCRLASGLAAVQELDAEKRERLQTFAELRLDWQDRLLGVITPDAAATILSRVATGDADARSHAERSRLQAELAWSELAGRPGADRLGALHADFPSELWRRRFAECPGAPTGPVTKGELRTDCSAVLSVLPDRPTLKAVEVAASRVSKARGAASRASELAAFRDVAWAVDAEAVAADLIRQGVFATAAGLDRDAHEATWSAEIAVWIAEGCIRCDELPWEDGCWEALLSPYAPAVVRTLAFLGLSPRRFAASLEGAPDWLLGDRAWAVVIFTAHSPSRFSAAADVDVLAESQLSALCARHAAKSLPPVGGMWIHRTPWPDSPGHLADFDYAQYVLTEVSYRYRTVLPQLPAELPDTLPPPWESRRRATESVGEASSVGRPAPTWTGTLLENAPWQARGAVLRVFGWRHDWQPEDEEAWRATGDDAFQHRLPVDGGLDGVLRNLALEGDGDALQVLAWRPWGEAPLKWSSLARCWPTGGKALARAFAAAWVVPLTVEQHEDSGPDAELRDAACTLLRKLPAEVLDVRLLSCVDAASFRHPAVARAIGAWDEEAQRSAYVFEPFGKPSTDFCIDAAERLGRREVLERIAGLPWRLIEQGALGLRGGATVWVGPRSLGVPEGLGLRDEATERARSSSGVPIADADAAYRTPASSTLEHALQIAISAGAALLRLGDPSALQRLVEAESLFEGIAAHAERAAWIRGVRAVLTEIDRACKTAERDGGPVELPKPPKAAAASLRALVRRGADLASGRESATGRAEPSWWPVQAGERGTRSWQVRGLVPGDEEMLAMNHLRPPPHIAVARFALLGRDDSGPRRLDPPELDDAQDTLVRAIAWLYEESDPGLPKALLRWLSSHGGETGVAWRCAQQTEAARRKAAALLVAAESAAVRAGVLTHWLQGEAPPNRDELHESPEEAPEAEEEWRVFMSAIADRLHEDDRLLDELWDQRPGSRVRQLLRSAVLVPEVDADTGTFRHQYRARRPWAVELLADMPEEELRALLPQCVRVPGVGRLIRRMLVADRTRRSRYAWAALLEVAEPGCPEWSTTLREWAVEDPQPWTGLGEFTSATRDFRRTAAIDADLRGGDGVLLAGLRNQLGKDRQSGQGLEPNDWRRVGLERLWTMQLDRVDKQERKAAGDPDGAQEEEEADQAPQRGRALHLPGHRVGHHTGGLGELFDVFSSGLANIRQSNTSATVRWALAQVGLPLRTVPDAEPEADQTSGSMPTLKRLPAWDADRILDQWVAEVASAAVILELAFSGEGAAVLVLPTLADRFPGDVLPALRRHLLAHLTSDVGEYPDSVAEIVLHLLADRRPDELAQLLVEHVSEGHRWRGWIESRLPELAWGLDGTPRFPIARLERQWSLEVELNN